MERYSNFSLRLREERERMQITQEQFAKLASSHGATGSTRQSQAKYESGAVAPTVSYLIALIDMGVNVMHLLSLDDLGSESIKGKTNSELLTELISNYDKCSDLAKRHLEEASRVLAVLSTHKNG